jgi:phage shock protein E
MKITGMLVITIVLFVLGACAHSPLNQAAAQQPLIIDVRTDQEWKEGHLDGAILIPHDRIGQEIAAVAPDKKTRIYLYCRTGRRTGLAFDELKKAGYEDLVNLSTLENASRELNLPIVK